jgi:uridylate kinase
MALIVQKFGGTSVGNTERMRSVARRVAKWKALGHDLVVVPSAMSGETNRLIALAKEIQAQPDPRELDVVASTGEQVTIGLLCMALIELGVKAKSYTGAQVRVVTNSAFTKARILSIDEASLRADFAKGTEPVVAGFQGVDTDGNITTLGRGGSDTSAVALAAALKADECQIYTDVDGVYTTDPRIVPEARRLTTITFEEMLEMASLGSKVLQIRSVEFAGKYKVPLRVLSSLTDAMIAVAEEAQSGTLITYRETTWNRQSSPASHSAVTRPRSPWWACRPAGHRLRYPPGRSPRQYRRGRDHQNAPMGSPTFPSPFIATTTEGDGNLADGSGAHRRQGHRRGQQGVQGVDGGCGHALARGDRQPDVPHPGRGGDQHPDDLHLRDQDIGGGGREIHGARRARAAQGLRAGPGAELRPGQEESGGSAVL